MKIGINETTDLVMFLARLTNVLSSVIKSNPIGIGWTITVNAIPLVTGLVNAVDGISNVPAELEDLDEKEKDKIVNAIKDKLNFSEDVEGVISIAFNIAYGIKKLIGVFK